MAKLDLEQVIAIAAIQQLVNDWAFDLDQHEGLSVHEMVTADCAYILGPNTRTGPQDIGAFYTDRLKRLSAQPEGPPTQRHIVSNLRVSFESPAKAAITFTLIHFTTVGVASGVDHADPAAVADVRMEVEREESGHWLFSKFDSSQTFRRVAQ